VFVNFDKNCITVFVTNFSYPIQCLLTALQDLGHSMRTKSRTSMS